jgi:hypothetical protein
VSEPVCPCVFAENLADELLLAEFAASSSFDSLPPTQTLDQHTHPKRRGTGGQPASHGSRRRRRRRRRACGGGRRRPPRAGRQQQQPLREREQQESAGLHAHHPARPRPRRVAPRLCRLHRPGAVRNECMHACLPASVCILLTRRRLPPFFHSPPPPTLYTHTQGPSPRYLENVRQLVYLEEGEEKAHYPFVVHAQDVVSRE